MIWGIQMSATHDHSPVAGARAYVNLIGFVMMSVFRHLLCSYAPMQVAAGQQGIHFVLNTVTVLVLTPGIALAISGQTEVLAQIGSVLAVLSMALFGFVVVRYGVGNASNEARSDSRMSSQPAE